jgi:tetratricopeptide (TPR) repeat protein
VALSTSTADTILELAQLYFDRCDFVLSSEKFNEAAQIYYTEGNCEKYLTCQNKLLRIHAERQDHEKIQETKEHLQDLVLKENFELNAKTYYTLGISALYKTQYDIALDYFQKSLSISLATDAKGDTCHAIYGLANCYGCLGRFSEALKEIYNLEVFFQIITLPELQVAAKMTNAWILNELKKHEKALEIYWSCYDDLRMGKNLYFYIFLLHEMGETYKTMGEADLARLYLKLAKRMADPENLKYLSSKIDKTLADLGVSVSEDYDLVLNELTNSVVERKKGKVDFKNQFILLDMLRTFMDQPGKVYSKENLVKLVWKQEYDPSTHDNKIYVTIKRLRKLIEPDYDKPKYIFRAKNGYYLNKTAKILLEQ